ncbi:MAG: EndoU domain-containing protein [Geminicoccaceae bacterium]
MSAGGLTGAGGGSPGGTTVTSAPPKEESALFNGYAGASVPKTHGARLGDAGDNAPTDTKTRSDTDAGAITEKQSQKLQDFDAVQGRQNFGDRHQDGVQDGDRQPLLLAGTAGVVAAEGAGAAIGRAAIAGGRVITAAGGVAAAGTAAVGAIIFMPTNASHDEVLTIPGHEQYRISGKSSEVSRSVEVANADGTWTKLGQVAAGSTKDGRSTVKLSDVNDILKDSGFKPIEPQPTSLPGAPIDGPKMPTILSTPIQEGGGVGIVSTPNDGPRGAQVVSTPIPKEQGPQIVNVEVNTDHILNGEIEAGEAKGFHHRVGGYDPVNAQLDEVIGLPDRNGVYEGEVSVRDPETGKMVPKDAPSTFFPDRMTGGEVEQAIKNAYEKRYDQKRSDGPFEGPSGEGFRIEGHSKNGVVTAAWPVYAPR